MTDPQGPPGRKGRKAPKTTKLMRARGSQVPPFRDIEDVSELETMVTKIKQSPLPKDKSKEGYLVIMYPPEAGLGKRILIKQSTTLIIGRHPSASLYLNVDSVSRRHAQVDNIGGTFSVRDLGSTNGTYINDYPVKRHPPLCNGDIIRIGTVLLKFLSGDDIEATYHDDVYRLTIIDGLTEAYNKRYLLDHMEREIERARRGGDPLTLVMIDIDHFKKFNDTYGHLMGDFVLKEVASRIHSTVRKNEIFARYGGEEFAVLLPNTDSRGAMEFAERARKRVCETTIQAEGNHVTVTISLGVYTFHSSEATKPETLIQFADANLYRAKEAGRNRSIGS